MVLALASNGAVTHRTLGGGGGVWKTKAQMVAKIVRPLFSYPTNQRECGHCLSAVKLGWWGVGVGGLFCPLPGRMMRAAVKRGDGSGIFPDSKSCYEPGRKEDGGPGRCCEF